MAHWDYDLLADAKVVWVYARICPHQFLGRHTMHHCNRMKGVPWSYRVSHICSLRYLFYAEGL